MTSARTPRVQGEHGAALVLAIAFLVLVGLIGAAVLASVTSGIKDRTVLDHARNREYAADGAIEASIGQIRSRMTNGQALSPCAPLTQTLENPPVSIQVDCRYAPTFTTSQYFQRNVVLEAHCASVQLPQCPNTSAIIIRAQVNFASPSLLTDPSITVTRTYVQSWSVNA